MDGQSPRDMKIWEMQDDDIHRIQYEERHYKFGIGHDLDPSALFCWPLASKKYIQIRTASSPAAIRR